jgi:adenylosuccinate lyase
VLMAAVRAGVGRESAHEAVKEHATAVALAMREHGAGQNDLIARLAADPRLQLDAKALTRVLADPLEFTGAAQTQTSAFVAAVEALLAKHPEARSYQPDRLL